MTAQPFQIVITEQPLDIVSAQKFVADPTFGAIASFVGVVRNHNQGRTVEAVTYDIHDALAIKALCELCHKALKKADGSARIYVAHAKGCLHVGEASVVIAVGTPHRKAAFDLCEFIIDQLKVSVPIWKNERYVEGDNVWLAGTPLLSD